MINHEMTETIWTPGGPDATWTVGADPDRYGPYVIEQVRREQEEWATEPQDENEIDRRLAVTDAHDQANVRLIGQAPRMAKVLNKLVDTIIATGGLIRFAVGFGCAGDEDWLDLADTAILALEVLNRSGVKIEIPITDALEREVPMG